MKREDIEHLASLARIRLTEAELGQLETELSTIVDYVGVVSDIAGSEADAHPQVGVRHNVFRTDETTNMPDEYTADILAEMPKTNGRFLSVKKILQTDE
jgi:aspartyl-tRNA(Asn)/glutamyl-tRNA(Gln) amidotransferase subunit C